MESAPVIGITGSLGSGKSLFIEAVQDRGVVFIDADRLGHEVVDSSPDISKKLAGAFGQDVLDSKGKLKRRLVRERAFANRDGLIKLNKAVHPALIRLLRERIAQQKMNPGKKPVIVDCALIFEWGAEDLFDNIVTVWADREVRLSRFILRDNMNPVVFEGIENAQLPQEEKIRRADIAVENNNDTETFITKARTIFDSLISK